MSTVENVRLAALNHCLIRYKTHFRMNENDPWTCIRHHLHDMRNHLNGVEMEVELLTSFLPDEKESEEPRSAAQRISAEVSLIEAALRSFATRFAPLNCQVVPATDVFALWRSRSSTGRTDSSHEWVSKITDPLICVDMKVVADLLCEMVPDQSCASEVSVGASNGGVVFQVRKTVPRGAPQGDGGRSRLPGWEEVISRNGGKYVESIDEGAGERISGCWFPCRTDDTPL